MPELRSSLPSDPSPPGGSSQSVTWPEGSEDGDYARAIAVEYQSELLGEIAVAKGRGEQITKQDDALLADLASQVGLAMRHLRLTEELRHRLIELQDSRKRIVAASDTQRRRMERDLHDGAQQQLVSMSVKLSLLRGLISRDQTKAEAMAG
ncbi:MAG TPA: histidine kinase [Actinomycetota bacterium]|nr:histidine kinase [Actinomycetota bacterium]